MIGKINVSYGSCKTDEDGNTEISFIISKESKFAIRDIIKAVKKLIVDGSNKFVLTLDTYKNKRSLMQNNMMWALLEIMGKAIGQSAWDCYVDMLEAHGAKYEYLMCLPKATEMIRAQFRAVKEVERRDYNGIEMIVYKCFYGSSKFNVKEMTALIDGIFDELASLGVDPSNDKEAAYLWQEWKQNA